MTKKDQFQAHFEKNKAAYQAWGNYIVEEIEGALSNKLGGKDKLSIAIKVPSSCRVKELYSALGKIVRKGYEDPIHQMTDLVGCRFVVLLSDHINLIKTIIESQDRWSVKLSKDYEEEIERNPQVFDYQSLHYEVRPKQEFLIGDVPISQQICCEMQIRTLLQHAYAELVHDNIYKPVCVVPASAKRIVARSMALMETTDQLFCDTMKILEEQNKPRNSFLQKLKGIFQNNVSSDFDYSYDEKTNLYILDEFKEYINDGSEYDILNLIEDKPYITTKISKRAADNLFFAQPVSLFIYYLVNKISPDSVSKKWTLQGYKTDLETIFSDLNKNPLHSY